MPAAVQPWLRAALRAGVCAALVAVVMLEARPVHAADRMETQRALVLASRAIRGKNYRQAKKLVDEALERLDDEDMSDDPSAAVFLSMKGALTFALENDPRGAIASFEKAVELDPNVKLPVGLRGDKLKKMMGRARSSVGGSAETRHEPPDADPSADLEFAVLFGEKLPDGSSAKLVWRPAGRQSFNTAPMRLYGNFAVATLAADEHQGRNLEYFFIALGPKGNVFTRLRGKNQPLRLDMGGGPDDDEDVVAVDDEPSSYDDDDLGSEPPPPPRVDQDEPMDVDEDERAAAEEREAKRQARKEKRAKAAEGPNRLPRVFLNLGLGTGVGLIRGRAEQTYRMYSPGDPDGTYRLRETSCALERWYAGGTPLAPDQETFAEHLDDILSVDPAILPAPVPDLTDAYDEGACSQREPLAVSVGSAPLHIAPEIGVRVGKNIVLSVYGRFQVVTGSQVYTEDPTKDLEASFQEDVRSPNPTGTKLGLIEPVFTYAVGAKFKYFLGKSASKFRPFVGAFAGYGWARIRVPMGFANDRNGNSVPDDREATRHGEFDDDGDIEPGTCFPVWPYVAACSGGARADAEDDLADSVRENAGGDERIDTLRLGPGFVGAAFGIHYQIIERVGFWAELDLGLWFPSPTTGLLDITLGPSITF